MGSDICRHELIRWFQCGWTLLEYRDGTTGREVNMNIIIKPLTPGLSIDYFDFFENRAFTDNSPYRCYCQPYQMTKEQEKRSSTKSMGLTSVAWPKSPNGRSMQAFCGAIWRSWTVCPSVGATQTTKRTFPSSRVPARVSTHRLKSSKKPWSASRSPQNFAEGRRNRSLTAGRGPRESRRLYRSRGFPGRARRTIRMG